MTLREILYALTHLAWASLLIPVGLGLWYWSRLSLGFKVLVVVLGSYLLLLPINYVKTITLIGWDSGSFFSYLFSLSFGIAFTFVFALNLPAGQKRRAVIALGLVGSIYLLVDVLFISGIHSRDGYSIPLMTGLQTVSTLIFLYHLVRHPAENSLLSIPLFWVAGAHLLSDLSGGVLDVFYPQLLAYSHRLLTYLYIFVWVNIIMCHLLYAVGIWKERHCQFRSAGIIS